jgi:hypothetical protein
MCCARAGFCVSWRGRLSATLRFEKFGTQHDHLREPAAPWSAPSSAARLEQTGHKLPGHFRHGQPMRSDFGRPVRNCAQRKAAGLHSVIFLRAFPSWHDGFFASYAACLRFFVSVCHIYVYIVIFIELPSIYGIRLGIFKHVQDRAWCHSLIMWVLVTGYPLSPWLSSLGMKTASTPSLGRRTRTAIYAQLPTTPRCARVLFSVLWRAYTCLLKLRYPCVCIAIYFVSAAFVSGRGIFFLAKIKQEQLELCFIHHPPHAHIWFFLLW